MIILLCEICVKLLQFYRLLINPMMDLVEGKLGVCSITLIFLVMKFGDKAQFRYVITKLS